MLGLVVASAHRLQQGIAYACLERAVILLDDGLEVSLGQVILLRQQVDHRALVAVELVLRMVAEKEGEVREGCLVLLTLDEELGAVEARRCFVGILAESGGEGEEGGIVLTLQELKSPEVIEEHRLQGCRGIESQSLCEEGFGSSVIPAVSCCEAGVDEAGIAGAINGRCRLLLGGGTKWR